MDSTTAQQHRSRCSRLKLPVWHAGHIRYHSINEAELDGACGAHEVVPVALLLYALQLKPSEAAVELVHHLRG